VASFRRQDLKPAWHPAGFVAWRPATPLPDLDAGEPVPLEAIAGDPLELATAPLVEPGDTLAARVMHDALERLAPPHVPIALDESLDVARCVEAA
jgi:hypothetical protein